MNSISKILAPLLIVSTTALAGVEQIRNRVKTAPQPVIKTTPVQSSPGTDIVVTHSIKQSNDNLGAEIATTTSSINNNKTAAAANTTNIANAGTNISSISSTQVDHERRITDLENRTQPDPTEYQSTMNVRRDIDDWGAQITGFGVYDNANENFGSMTPRTFDGVTITQLGKTNWGKSGTEIRVSGGVGKTIRISQGGITREIHMSTSIQQIAGDPFGLDSKIGQNVSFLFTILD